MGKRFLGLDWSMQSPAISCLDENGEIVWMKFFAHKAKHEGDLGDKVYGITYPIYSNDVERFYKLGTEAVKCIQNEIDQGHEVSVVIEGYSFGSTGARLFQIAENCGTLKTLLFLAGIPFTVVPPTSIKKFATGKGNCDKDAVYQEFMKQFGIKLHDTLGMKTEKAVSPISDLADSVFMAKWAKENLNG